MSTSVIPLHQRTWRSLCSVVVLLLVISAPSLTHAQTAMELFKQGYDAILSENYPEAERLFRSGLDKGGIPPNFLGLAHYYLAEALSAQKKSEQEALQHYQGGSRLIPQTNPEAADANAKAEELKLAARPAPPPREPPNTMMRPSTFQNSCSAIQFTLLDGKPALRAQCRRINQTVKTSTLVLRGISIENGQFVQGVGPSSFHQSCDSVVISTQGSIVLLSALCRMVNGAVVKAQLPLQEIENIDGNLRY